MSIKVYETRYHSKRPYCVEVSEHTVDIFEQMWDDTNEYWYKGKRVYQSSYERIFIGDIHPLGVYLGNTILLHIHADKYVFIGDMIYTFSVVEGDQITQYVSTLQDLNGAPTPYAIGKQRVYLMKEYYSLSMVKREPDTEIPFIPTMIHNWFDAYKASDNCV